MPVYGSFETVREVSRSGLGAVYTARRVGSTDERFAIKLFRPPASLGMEDDEIERDSKYFINAAEVQKGLGRAGSAWAPIYETGRMEGGAWYATDLFDRSIERLLLNRPDLEPADLLRVVDSVVSGLFELRDAAARAHGNLKTSNVLLSGKGDVAAARIVLCDPWASERLRGGEAREDLRGLGDLIHWLVLHRGVRRPTGWPVQVSPEWKRLGRVGDGWLSLTNKLLDPTDDKLTLDEVPGLVPGGKVRPGSSTTVLPTPVTRAARESKPESKHESKAELPKSEPAKSAPAKSEPAKSEPAKVEPAKPEVAKPEPAKPEPVKSEPVRPEPAKVEPVKVESAPVRPASSPAAAAPATPPQTPASPAAVDADVTQDLPSHGSGVGVGAGSGVGSAVGASGSREAVASGAADAGVPAAATVSRAPSMTNVGRVSTASMAGAPKSFEELEAESRRRQAEPKKASNAKWIGIGVGAVALVAVAAVVIANLPSKPPVTPGPNPTPAPTPTPPNPGPDPRIAETERSIDGIREALAAGRRYAEGSASGSIESLLAKVTNEFVDEAEGGDASRRGVRDRAVRLGAIAKAKTLADALDAASQGESEAREGVARAIELLAAPKPGDLGELRARAADFARLRAVAAKVKDSALKDRALARSADAFGAWFTGVPLLDSRLEQGAQHADGYGVPGELLPESVKVSRLIAPLENVTDKSEGAKRVEVVRQEIESKHPSLAGAAKPHLDELSKKYAVELVVTPPPVTPTPVKPEPPPVNPNAAKIAQVKSTVQKIAGHLSLGLGFKDVAPDGGESIEELLKQIDVSVEKDSVAGDAALTDALARARGLADIAAIADAPAAAKRAADEGGRGRASETLAAATRALSLFKDPAAGDLDALEAGGKFLEGVRDSVGKLPNGVAARRDAIVKTANDRRRAIYLATVGKVAIDDATALRRAAGLAAGFGVKPDELPVKARLNLLSLALKDDLAKASDDAAATAVVTAFKNAAGALGAEVAPAVARIIEGLDAAAKTPEAPAGPVLDFSKVGPMSTGSGWSLDPAHPAASDFSSVTYKSPSGQSVQFLRLTGTNTYLAATETTVGVFNDAAQRDGDLLNILFSLNTGKARNKGPSVWERTPTGDGIRPSSPGGWDTRGWLADVSALAGSKIKPYPDELLSSVGTPSALHPMQQVSSTVASRVAGKIGCRLPTAEEWRVAAGMTSAADARIPNRRDATWNRFKVYLDGQIKTLPSGAPVDSPWPDNGTCDPKKVNTGSKAVPAVTEDDQVLWFREVGAPDGRFHDLVGNAAEWVAPPASAAGQIPNDVARAQVIGVSALSADQYAPDAALDPTNRARTSFSDVGFRLAFDAAGGTAPAPEPLSVRLKKAADAIVLAK